MARHREVPAATPTDRSEKLLEAAGWEPHKLGPWLVLWTDPYTGVGYVLSQAYAIYQDRLRPRYRFRGRKAY